MEFPTSGLLSHNRDHHLFPPLGSDPRHLTTVYREVHRQEEAAERPRAVRPIDQIVAERALRDFSTTNSAFFRGTPAERSLPYSLKQQIAMSGELFGGPTTDSAAYRRPPERKRIEHRARSETQGLFDNYKQTESANGKMQTRSLYGQMFYKLPFDRSKAVKLKQELEMPTGPFQGESLSRADFRDPGAPDRFAIKKPFHNLSIKSEAPCDYSTTSSSTFQGHTGKRRSAKKLKPEMRISETPIDFSSSYAATFFEKETERATQTRHSEEFSFPDDILNLSTTNSDFFKEWDESQVEKRKTKKLKQEITPPSGDFAKFTTSSDCFKEWNEEQIKKRKPKKQKQEIRPPSGHFATSTTNSDCFKEWSEGQVIKIKPKKPKQEIQRSGDPFAKLTTNSECFKEWDADQIERRKGNKLKEQIELPSGEFTKTTTNTDCFKTWDGELIERRQPKKQKQEMRMPSGHFATSTTNSDFFREWHEDQVERVNPKKLVEQMEKPEGAMAAKSEYSFQFREVEESDQPTKFRLADELKWAGNERDFIISNKQAFAGGHGSAFRMRRLENQIPRSTETFAAQTVNQLDFAGKALARVKPVIPPAENISRLIQNGDSGNAIPKSSRYRDFFQTESSFSAPDIGLNETRKFSASPKNKSQILLG